MTRFWAVLDDSIRRWKMPSTKNGVLVQRLNAPSPLVWSVPAGLGVAAVGSAFLDVPGVPPHALPVVLGASAAAAGSYLFYRRRVRPFHRPLSRAFRGWNDLTRSLGRSPNKAEREHLFLGTIEDTGEAPVLVNREILNDHTLTLGGSGVGKTAKDLVPRMCQIIRRRESSLIYITTKLGDHATFYSLALAAREARVDFRWFTTASDRSSYIFNPLTQSHLKVLDGSELAEYVTKLLGLDHGAGYGRDWFRDIGTDVLKRFLEAFRLRSFAEIAEKWHEPDVHRTIGVSRREFTDNAAHVRVLIDRLARLGPRYNATAASGLRAGVLGAAIDMTDFFRRPRVLYVEVAAQRAALTVSPVGRSIIHAAVDSARELRGPKCHLDIYVDEFSNFLSHDLDSVFKTARDSDVSLAVASQALSDFRKPDFDYVPVILENVRMIQIFRSLDRDGHDFMVRNSGQRIRLLETEGETATNRGWGSSRQRRQTIVPRIDAEQIERMNQDPDLSVIAVTPGAGFAQFRPLLMRSYYHIGRREFERRRRLPWPRPNAFTVGPTPRPEMGPAGPPRDENRANLQPAESAGGPDGASEVPGSEPGVAARAEHPVVATPVEPLSKRADAKPIESHPGPAAPRDRKPREGRSRKSSVVPEGPDPTGDFLQNLYHERESQP